jgi:MoaA/NifB/PqqE/SkfB family radical SAM enzyme
MGKLKPKFILYNFELTTYCNAKCPSCTRTVLDLKNLKHLPVSDFEDFVFNNYRFLKSDDREVVAKFCGEVGDPMMHPKLSKIIEMASIAFDKIEIFTNGGLRNNKFVKDILENPKVHFIFGIDGTTDEVNQKYRIGVNTKLALSNMIVSAKHRFTKWDYTIFEHNYHQLQDAIDFAEDHGIYILARVNSRPFAKLNPNKLSYVEDILKKNRTNYYLCK